jgi:hypothetical protein
MSPQCSTKRSTAAGNLTVFSVFSVMTEISEMTEAMSRGGLPYVPGRSLFMLRRPDDGRSRHRRFFDLHGTAAGA